MKNLKNTVAAITMMTVMAFGTTFANAGIVIAYSGEAKTRTTTESKPNACTEDTSSDLVGIVIAFAGIIITTRTGIVIAKDGDTAVRNCGIVIA